MTGIKKKLAASFICFAMLLSVFSVPVDVLAVNAQANGTGSVIFINGDTGSDEAEGKTDAEPVKTIDRAKTLLGGEKGTVMVTGTVTVEDTQNWDLGGATIKRNAGFDGDLVDVKANGSLAITNTVMDGAATDKAVTGSLVKVEASGALTLGSGTTLQNNNSSASGAGVSSSGTVEVKGAAVKDNSTEKSGGGICNQSGGKLTIDSGEITGNKAAQTGGGIDNEGAPPRTRSSLVMNGGTVEKNISASNGGGIYSWFGNVTINDGAIRANSSTGTEDTAGTGGGLYLWIGAANIKGGVIEKNTASDGAGIHICMGTLTAGKKACVKDNTTAEGTKKNITSDTVSVTEAFEDGAYISMSDSSSTLSGSDYTLTEKDAGYVHCDDEKFAAKLDTAENTISFEEIKVEKEQWDKVYINGETGSDESDGSSAEKAVKTFAEAKDRLKENGTVYVTGMINVKDKETWSLADKGDAKIIRDESYAGQEPGEENDHDYIDGPLAQVIDGGSLTLSDIHVDGNGRNVESVASAFTVKDGQLNVRDGAVIEGQKTMQHNGGAIYIYKDGALDMSGGEVRDNQSVGYGGGIYNGGSFEFSGGTVTGNAAGYNGGGIFNSGSMEMSGKLIVRDNKLNGEASDLYMAKGKYAVMTAALSDDADIKVDSHLKPANIIRSSSSYTITEADAGKIALDSSSGAYKLELKNGAIYIALTAQQETEAVYLDGASGSDSNDGSVKSPVKTFGHAMELVKDNGTIYVTGAMEVADTQVWDGKDRNITVKRHYEELGYLVTVKDGGSLSLKNITVDGDAEKSGISAEDSMFLVEKGGSLTAGSGAVLKGNSSVSSGGAVYNNGSFTLKGAVLKDNETKSGIGGGAVFNAPDAVLKMISGSISDNSAYCGGGIENEGKLIIQGGKITGNKTRGGGAGVHNFGENGGSFRMYGGEISGNSSSEHYGGAVFLWQCSGTFSGGLIEGNTAAEGSGIYAFGLLTVSGNVRIKDGITQLRPMIISSSLADSAVITMEDTGTVAKSGDEYTVSEEDAAKFRHTEGHRVYFNDEKNNVNIAETGISLDHSELAMKVGEEATLKAKVTPDTEDQTVTWTSSDEKTAVVSDGTVKAAGVGTAVITAANKDGEKTTCKVTVEKKKQTITADPVEKTYGCKAFCIKVEHDGSGKLSYSSSDKKIATVAKDGKITVRGTGIVRITVKVAETDDCLGAQTTVKLTVAPKKTVLSGAVSKKRGQISVKWKKDSKATGYQVSVSRDKSFKKGTVTKNVKGSSKTFTKLKKGKKYYVKVRSYKTSEGKKIYGNYSRVKTVKVK